MTNKVQNTIKKFNMLCNNDSIIVGLSGGADSVCLLHVLLAIKDKYNLNIFAAHINHNLRGEESLRDENFVKNLCNSYNVKLFVKSVEIAKIAASQNISTELCGRNIRYDFFNELSQELNAKIATAHTASDNCETVLFNIARGCSVKGLCGIPPVRDNIIRPLIEVTRTEVEEYCNNNFLDYVTDSSNLTDDYTRNKIRHNAVPVFKEINSNFENNILRLNSQMTDIDNFLTISSCRELKQASCKDGYYCDMLIKLPNVILKQCILLIFKQAGIISTEEKHINLCIDAIKNRTTTNLPNGYCASAVQNVFRVYKDNKSIDFKELPLLETKEINFNNKHYFFNIKNNNSNLQVKNQCIDLNCINSSTVIRTRHAADKFTLPQRCITKSLKKLLNEAKAPKEQRDSLLLVANGSTVLWLEGFGTAQQASINKETKSFIEIEVNNKN